jgi:hypothetical protein
VNVTPFVGIWVYSHQLGESITPQGVNVCLLFHPSLPSFWWLLTGLHLMINPLHHILYPNRQLPIKLIILPLPQLLHEVPWFVSLEFAILIGRNKSLLMPLMLRSLTLCDLIPRSLILGDLIPWSLILGQWSSAEICLSWHFFLDLWSLSLEKRALGSNVFA